MCPLVTKPLISGFTNLDLNLASARHLVMVIDIWCGQCHPLLLDGGSPARFPWAAAGAGGGGGHDHGMVLRFVLDPP